MVCYIYNITNSSDTNIDNNNSNNNGGNSDCETGSII